MHGVVEIRIFIKNHIPSVTFRVEFALFEYDFSPEIFLRIRVVVLLLLLGLRFFRFVTDFGLRLDILLPRADYGMFGFAFAHILFYRRTYFYRALRFIASVSAEHHEKKITRSNRQKRENHQRADERRNACKRINNQRGNNPAERIARITIRCV